MRRKMWLARLPGLEPVVRPLECLDIINHVADGELCL